MADEIEIPIAIPTKDAINSVQKLEDQTKKSVQGMESAFKSLKAIAGIAVAALAGREVVQFFEAGIEAAINQENALAKLATQMALTGEASDEALKSFADFADEMEKTTKFEDDVILSNLALAKSFGITNEQAEDLIKAATDLSATTGKDLDSSVRLLGKTFSGVLGPLDEVDNSLKGLTKEELANGEAVRLLGKRFEGTANNEIKTFAGAINQAEKSFGNFAEAFGKIIIENKSITATIKAFGDAFSTLQSNVDGGSSAISDFIDDALEYLLIIVPVVVLTIEGLYFSLKSLLALLSTFGQSKSFITLKDLAKTVEGMDKLNESIEQALIKIAAADNATIESTKKSTKERDKFNRSIKQTAEETNKLKEEAEKFGQQLTKSAASDLQKLTIEREENLKKVKEFEEKRAIELTRGAELRETIEKDFATKTLALAEKTGKEQVEIAKKSADEARSAIEKIAQAPIKFLVETGGPLSMENGLAIGAGIASRMLEGAQGAKALISEGLGAAADQFLPGIGGVVSSIIGKLAEGPDATKRFVRDFVEAIPDIVEAIAESIPAFVEALVDSLINEGGIVRIAVALATAMAGEAVWKAIGKQIGFEVSNKLTDGAKQAGTSISNAMKNAALAIGAGFVGVFQQIGGFFSGMLQSAMSTSFAAGIASFTTSLGELFTNGAASFGTMFATAFKDLGTIFSDALKDIGAAILKGFDDALIGLKTGIEGIFTGIGDGITKIVDGIAGVFNPLIEAIGKLKIEIPGVTGGGGGGSDNSVKGKLKAGFKKVFPGAAEGGRIPDGFPNDTFPALLTSGEQVFDNTLTPKLEKFLDGQSSDVTNALLAKIIELLSAPINVNTTANVNGRAFADIILQLNRNNARLTG